MNFYKGARMNQRVKHVDVAKGISIILVVMYHSKLKLYFPEVIDSMALFRMPLFFLLSGIFFSWKLSPKDFFLKKFEALLKPYFFVLFSVLLISFAFTGESVVWNLKGVLYGNGNTLIHGWAPMWFLTHLFIIYAFVYLLFRFFKVDAILSKNWFLLFVFILIGSAFIDSFWYKEFTFFNNKIVVPGLPFSIDIILVTASYFIFGYIFKSKLIDFNPDFWIFIVCLVVLLLVSQFTSANLNFNRRISELPIYSMLGAFSGIYVILTVSHVISKGVFIRGLLLHIGKSSLYILVFHAFILRTSEKYLNAYVDDDYLVIMAFLSFGLGVFIPLILRFLIEKSNLLSLFFLPFKSNKLVQRVMASKA